MRTSGEVLALGEDADELPSGAWGQRGERLMCHLLPPSGSLCSWEQSCTCPQEGGWDLLQHQHRAPEPPGELRLAVGQEAVSSIVHTCARLPGEWRASQVSGGAVHAALSVRLRPPGAGPHPALRVTCSPSTHARRTGVSSALGCNCRCEQQEGSDNREVAVSPCGARLRRFSSEPSLRLEPQVAAWLLDPSPAGLHVGERQSPAWRGAASFSLQVRVLVEVRLSAGRKQMQLSP